jgi:predicted MFS family arabinose efflux permease
MLGVTLGKVALGWINDRSAKLGILAFSVFGMIGLTFLLIGKKELAFMVAGGFLYGWAYAAVTVETALLVRTVFGTKDYAKLFSNISIALSGGGAIMSGGWGYLVGFISFDSILLIGMVLLIISAMLGMYSMHSGKNFKP